MAKLNLINENDVEAQTTYAGPYEVSGVRWS